MIEAEFVIPPRLENLFNVSSREYHVTEMDRNDITRKIIQLKPSMYADAEGFIFKHFDLYCNIIRHFLYVDDDSRITAFKTLYQVAEKMVHAMKDGLEKDTEEFEKDVSFKYRNMIMMNVYVLCQFAQAFEGEISKKNTKLNVGKGRKKTKSQENTEYCEWLQQRVKFAMILKKIFQLPIRKFWSPPIIDYEFMNLVTTSGFKLLENVEISRDRLLKTEIFRFLGSILTEDATGIAYSLKILQMVQDFEHLPNVMADAVLHFVTENFADTLVADICREATLLDQKSLLQNSSASHSLSLFLVSVTERCPEKVLHAMSNLLQFLEMESHVMRNCILLIIGILLTKLFSNGNLTAKDQKTRGDLLTELTAHLLDVSSFVRSKAIQVFKTLVDKKALASVELYDIGKLISIRIGDKASSVRKNAVSFMGQFIDINQFACKIPLTVLRESYQMESEKLKKMRMSRPFVFEDSDDEDATAGEKSVLEPMLFEDSDDEDQEKRGDGAESNEGQSVQENAGPSSEVTDSQTDADMATEEQFKKQQDIVAYLKNTLNFAEVIYSVVEPVSALLHSYTQTDVLEAVEFFASAGVLANIGLKKILDLVWSTEAPVRDAALKAFKNLYLSNIKDQKDVGHLGKNLVDILKDGTKDEELNLQPFINHFNQQGDIPKSLSTILWGNLINPDSGVTEEEKIQILLLLGMMAEECPEFVIKKFDAIMQYGLASEGEKNFQLAKYTFKVLCKANLKNRGKRESGRASDAEIRVSADHVLINHIKRLLINGISNFNDDQWTPMADEAVATIFSLIEDPSDLVTEMILPIADIVRNEVIEVVKGEEVTYEVSNVLLARAISLCGFVALHYLNYLKVDHFAYLRRQEYEREKRRRRRTTFSPRGLSGRKTPKSKNKRMSINKSYRLMPPIDEETTYEEILEMCGTEIKDETTLIGCLLPIVVTICQSSLSKFNKEVLAASSMALVKFMLFSEVVCEENMQLFATIVEKSPAAFIRANMLVAMADLTKAYPNVVDQWMQQIYKKLNDSDVSVREAAIITLTHLILHDYVRVKRIISEAAKCIADEDKSVEDVAKYLFTELSEKGNIIYNIIPDVISSLSDLKSGFSEEKFQVVLKHMLKYVEKEKLIEGLVEKLCCRFTDSSSEIQLHEVTFCLSALTLNDKCYGKLMEFKNLLKERMSDPVIKVYITDIIANAKKNDAKTAAELERFRNELGI